jgi:hypothetical protein
LEKIIDYLYDPLKKGVWYGQFSLDLSGLEDLFRHLAELAKKKKIRSKDLLDIADTIKEEGVDSDDVSNYFGIIVQSCVRVDECPKEMMEYVIGHEIDESVSPDRLRHMLIRRIGVRSRVVRFGRYFRRVGARPRIFDPHVFTDIGDVVLVDLETVGRSLLFEVTSITERGISRFQDFIKCFPIIGETFSKVKRRKTSSTRYTFRPYPLAVQLWLESEKSGIIPKDLRDFFQGSVRYFHEKEWRTSIVLSAIAVEVILADLHEEEIKEYAPNKPLGELYYKLKEKIAFPENIQKAIEIANDARISAVHRSRFPVSDRDATNALYGATNFTIWFYSKY